MAIRKNESTLTLERRTHNSTRKQRFHHIDRVNLTLSELSTIYFNDFWCGQGSTIVFGLCVCTNTQQVGHVMEKGQA